MFVTVVKKSSQHENKNNISKVVKSLRIDEMILNNKNRRNV